MSDNIRCDYNSLIIRLKNNFPARRNPLIPLCRIVLLAVSECRIV